ncbi:hypothetical protein QUF76_16150 [Desulfobacterales bacterium HSG16]|nr:hypothetical protein [Desulfobacterales bacterium HSG16]
MKSGSKWHILPMMLVFAGVAATCGITWANADTLGQFQWHLYAASLLPFIGALLFRNRVASGELELGKKKSNFESDQIAFNEEMESIRTIQKELDEELKNRAERLEKQVQNAHDKLMAFHEWAEFADMLDAEPSSGDKKTHAPDKKDRQLNKLLKNRAEVFADKLLNEKYHENGKFQGRLLFDDIARLTVSVARIYQPDTKNPLLETSTEKLLRAISRISLHLIIILDQLPLNVKEYNLNNTYDYINKGIKVHSLYKTGEPYMTYANYAWNLGRLAMGASPVTLGAWYFAGQAAKTGTKSLSSHLSHKYTIRLVQDMVGIIGSEVATVFGSDLRHREPDWIYGIELAHLCHLFPLSKETLLNALSDVSTLRLKSEYDRLYLFRCLAGHKSPDPEKYMAGRLMNEEKREAVVHRLEDFFHQNVHGKTEKRVDNWKSETEERLKIKLKVEYQDIPVSNDNQIICCINSIAGFLIDIKNLPVASIADHIKETRIFALLDKQKAYDHLKWLEENPPMIFEFADIEPADPLVDSYIEDLMNFCVRIWPNDQTAYALCLSAIDYYRTDSRTLVKKLDRAYAGFLSENTIPESPVKRIEPFAACAFLNMLEKDELPCFIYNKIDVRFWVGEVEALNPYKKMKLFLMGTQTRLILMGFDTNGPDNEKTAHFLWTAAKNGEYHAIDRWKKKRIHLTCQISGGKWMPAANLDEVNRANVVVKPKTLRGDQAYFLPLENFFTEIE